MESSSGPRAALVTGGARRLGRAMALQLAGMGFDIALHYRASREDAEATASEIRAIGVQCETLSCDLTAEAECSGLIPRVFERFPHLSLLVNNASVYQGAPIARTNNALLDSQFAIHVKAPFILSREFATRCKSGLIVNILDWRIATNQYSHAAYVLAKKSLAALTEMCALEFAPRIRVNGIAPGVILPPEHVSPGYIEQRLRSVPLLRKGEPETVARALAFLVENDYITGQIIYADGGEHL